MGALTTNKAATENSPEGVQGPASNVVPQRLSHATPTLDAVVYELGTMTPFGVQSRGPHCPGRAQTGSVGGRLGVGGRTWSLFAPLITGLTLVNIHRQPPPSLPWVHCLNTDENRALSPQPWSPAPA